MADDGHEIGAATVGTAVVASSATEKLDLAEYNFDKTMKTTRARDFAFELSNFLAAARSVCQIMMTEAEAAKSASALKWIKDTIDANAGLSLLRDERDKDMKERLVEVRRVYDVQLTASLSFRGALAAGPPGSEVRESSPTAGMGTSTTPVQNSVSAKAYFPSWTGPEDIGTLCSQMLHDLQAMLAAFPAKLQAGRPKQSS